MTSITLPGLGPFLAVLALGALTAISGAVCLGGFVWAHVARRPRLRRRFGVAAAVLAALTAAAVVALVILD